MKNDNGISELEVAFVNGCIVRERKNRLLFELSTAEKRNNAISRFAHQTDALAQTKRIVSIVDSEHVPPCYFDGDLHVMYLADNGGKSISQAEAKSRISNSYGPLIVISSLGLAVIKTEDNRIYLLNFASSIGKR